MPRYMLFAKFTPQALAAIRDAGYATREAPASTVWEQLGGSLEAYYFTPSSEWDQIQIGQLPGADEVFAMMGVGRSSGAIERVSFVELRTGTEADATSGQSVKYAPPVQS